MRLHAPGGVVPPFKIISCKIKNDVNCFSCGDIYAVKGPERFNGSVRIIPLSDIHLHHFFKLGILTRQGTKPVLLGDHLRVGQERTDFFVAFAQALKFFSNDLSRLFRYFV